MNLYDLSKYLNQSISLSGWVHAKRGNNKIQFLQIRNSGKIIQVVCEKEKLGEVAFEKIKALPQETSIDLKGTLVVSEKSELGYEIILGSYNIVGDSHDYPITPKEHGPDFLHNNRHLWLRSKRQLSILQIRNELSFQIRKYFHENHYVLIDTPILTGSVGESAGTLFETEYFDEGKAYLAQTGQLYLETAIFAHTQVYCFGPTFRAEKSKTRRHLTEFWMLEAETANYHNEENINLQEDFIRKIVTDTVNSSLGHLKILEREPETILGYVNRPFKRILYNEAIEILKSKGEGIEWGEDINAEREYILTTYFDGPVFVMNYPRSIKAFYMKQNPQDERTVLCADLIAPEGVGEIIGGSEREENYDKIVERLREENLPVESYSWYLDLRKYGSVPHAGFGLGLERLVAWICGLPHVRECIPFPRLMGRLYP
ncbi:MAG: asparagine--tRNA ligase [Leptospiraceae bacterium]|nr:asparagine--tRNA ligase [Leptospiraceae bacterium]MBK9501623.1 asparagine--tRNA ligase [Leptospiraceae bacterium]